MAKQTVEDVPVETIRQSGEKLIDVVGKALVSRAELKTPIPGYNDDEIFEEYDEFQDAFSGKRLNME